MSNPNLQFSSSTCKLRRVKKLQLGVFSPECIVSLCRFLIVNSLSTYLYSGYLINHPFLLIQRAGSVTTANTIDGVHIRAGVTKFDRFENGRPVYGGVNDPRMGSFDKRY